MAKQLVDMSDTEYLNHVIAKNRQFNTLIIRADNVFDTLMSCANQRELGNQQWTQRYLRGEYSPHYPVPAIPAKVDWQNVFCLGSIYRECRISTNNGWNTLKSWKW